MRCKNFLKVLHHCMTDNGKDEIFFTASCNGVLRSVTARVFYNGMAEIRFMREIWLYQHDTLPNFLTNQKLDANIRHDWIIVPLFSKNLSRISFLNHYDRPGFSQVITITMPNNTWFRSVSATNDTNIIFRTRSKPLIWLLFVSVSGHIPRQIGVTGYRT